MSDETKCPGCGAIPKAGWWHSWECGSTGGTDGTIKTQSLGCRITQLEQKLAVAVAALKPFAAYWGQLLTAERHPSESVVPLPPNPEDYRAASEALKKIGATP